VATTGKRGEPMRLEAALSGILAMLVAEREERPRDMKAGKTEVILASSGLSNDEIAMVTGKSADAIRKTIERSRKPT
jgi:hypothetical protein